MAKKKTSFQKSSLKDHKQIGKQLVPPFQQLGGGMDQIFWARDLLPEFLWIDGLVHTYGPQKASQVFRDFLNAADSFVAGNDVLDGTVTSFRLISDSRRTEFLENHSNDITSAIRRPVGYLCTLYKHYPMSWMVPDLAASTPSDMVPLVRAAVVRLSAGKDAHAAFCRMFPLNRYFAHEKVKIFGSLTETIEAIKTYPNGDRQRAETFARSTHNMMFTQKAIEDPTIRDWARSFWRENLKLTPLHI